MSDEQPRQPRSRAMLYLHAVATLIVLVLALLPGEKQLTIAIHQGVEGVALKQAAAKFAEREQRPVEVVELPYDRLFDAELEQVNASTSAYDVIMSDDPWMPALDKPNGKVPGRTQNLKRLALSSGTCAALGDFVPSLMRVSRTPYTTQTIGCGDAFYALPFVGNSQLFAIRKGTTTPATWNDATRDEGYVLRVGPGNPIVTDFVPMLWGASPKSFPPEPGATLTLLPPAADAIGFLSKLGRRPANLGIISYDDFDLSIQLARGQARMSIVWSAWAMAMASVESPGDQPRLVDSLDFIQIPGSKPELGAWLLAIPENAADTAGASAFIEFVTSREQLQKAALLGNPPPRRSLLTDKSLAVHYPTFPQQLESLEQAQPRPRTPYWRAVEQSLGRCLSAVYESAITEQEALHRSNAAIERAMKGERVEGFNCMTD